jgi:hypothetical protein
MNSKLTKYGLLALSLIFVAMAMAVGATTATAQYGAGYRGYGYTGYGGYYHHWGYNYNAWQARQNGYRAGYSDGSNNNQYDCVRHTTVYCSSYGKGYADGQTQYNQNNQQPTQGQGQQQSSNSASYSQSNPNVKVVINNVIPDSNNSTAGAAQNHGTGENN